MKRQKGGFAIGLVVGLLLGLALALGVALYVTKVPVPFMNKVPQRTAEQDAAEAARNRNWDPNAGLGGKPQRPPAAASVPAAVAPGPTAATPSPSAAARPPAPGRDPAAPGRDPAAILAGEAAAPTARTGAPFVYFVQAGAYARADDAEQQRARLAMLGLAARVTEREQNGRTVFRVRVGPFDDKGEADAAHSRLAGSGVDAALVRVER